MNGSDVQRSGFRFGVVGSPRDADAWRAAARKVEELGYSSLLVPDGTRMLSPLPALAVAAGVTSRLHVGTWVLAAPLRPPGLAAWDAHTLAVLSGGRFELGIGTGLPDAAEQGRRFGLAVGGAADRLVKVAETVETLRDLDGDGPRTPVLMAVSGPKATAFAAEHADSVAFALPPTATPADFDARVVTLREAAGDRFDRLELVDGLLAVGDDLPPWIGRATGSTPDALRESGAQGWLRGSPDDVADALLQRRERWGTSYVTVPEFFAEWFAPVVERLAGS